MFPSWKCWLDQKFKSRLSFCEPSAIQSSCTAVHRCSAASERAVTATKNYVRLTTVASPPTTATASLESGCCDVCLIALREGFVLVSCGRAHFCENCANAVSSMCTGCQICSTNIEFVMRIFNIYYWPWICAESFVITFHAIYHNLLFTIFNVRQSPHVIDIGCPSVCLSDVRRWYCVETAQPIVKLSSLPGSPMILVFWGPNFSSEFQLEHPYGGVKCKEVGKKLQFPTNISL